MSLSRALCAFLVTCAASAACSEEPATSVGIPEAAAPVDLDLTFPDVSNRTLVRTEVEQAVADPSGPAPVFADDPPDDSSEPLVASKIISASTNVGFQYDYAFSSGRQRYTGNHGEISTTATVSYAGTVLGTQPASRQVTGPYLLDGGQEHTLWVDAYVFVDQRCGLKVNGDSQHLASWQWFIGTVANFGEDRMTTQAFPPADQPPCEEIVEPYGPGGGNESGGSEDGGVVTCWYLVTIDYQTGEIIDARFLYCDGVEEGG